MSTIDEEAMAWLVKVVSRDLSETERQAFDAWYAQSPLHQGVYIRAQVIWRTLDKATVQPNLIPDNARISKRMIAARSQVFNRRTLVAGIAASVLAAISGAAYYGTRTKSLILRAPTNEAKRFVLADGSIATLNANASMEVNMELDLRRIKLLQGEALFQVAKNRSRPFRVESGGIHVQAVGTAFSVRKREGAADVMVTEGIVETWTEDGAAGRQRLIAGETAKIFEGAQIVKAALPLDEIDRRLAWRRGKIILQDVTLEDAATEFNRYNAQKIAIVDPSIRAVKFTGQYRVNEPLKFAEGVQSLLDVPVKTTSDSIVIGKTEGYRRRTD